MQESGGARSKSRSNFLHANMNYMTQLTQIAITARKMVRYSIYFIIFLTAGKILLDLSIGIYKKIFPAPPPPPTVKFGKLTKIPFPVNTAAPKLTYTLETPDGGFPKEPNQAKVYFMPKVSANLLSLDTAKEKANAMGFNGDALQVSDTDYKFKSKDYPVTLEMNIISGVFSISYDLNADRTPIEKIPPVPEVGASAFRSFLSGANILPDDLTGPTSHDFLKLSAGKFVSALSLSESNAVKVNLFRKSYDNLPAMTANPNEANVWAILTGAQDKNRQIIAAEYHYFPVDESQFSTYPIKTPEEAFSELQNGKAYIASLGLNKDGGSLKIRRVYLAYFDPETQSEFYQPIYVFEGDNGFVAYDPAVTSQYYGQ